MTARRLVLLCVLAAPVLSLLGVRGLNEPDEGRYTEIAREMLVTGDWIIPRIKGVPHWAKPPLTYWSVAASMAVFGYNEWAARLPSAVAAVITLLLVYLIGKDIAGRRAGVLAALALGSTLEFFALARIVNTDMIHTALITGACAAFWFWRRGEESGRPRPAWRFAFWICLGLGFLNKGPIPLMVVAGALAPFVFRSSLRPRWRRLGPGWGVPVLVVLGASWYLEAIRRKPELLDHFLFDELGDRVAEGLGRAQPWYYFLIVFPLVFLPWTPLLAAALMRWWRTRDEAGHDRAAHAFLLGWLVLPFCVFSAASSKLWTYVLPLCVPAALLAGRHAATWWETRARRRGLAVTWAAAHAAFLIGLVLLPSYETRLGNNASFRGLVARLAASDAPLVGVPIPEALAPDGVAPRHEARGIRLVSYRFRFGASAFYLLRDRPEYVPYYGGDTLWEAAVDRDADRPPTLEDLAELLRGADTVWVLTRRRYVERLESASGRRLTVLESVGEGRSEVVVVTNAP